MDSNDIPRHRRLVLDPVTGETITAGALAKRRQYRGETREPDLTVCSQPGCTRPRHVSKSGRVVSWCRECIRVHSLRKNSERRAADGGQANRDASRRWRELHREEYLTRAKHDYEQAVSTPEGREQWNAKSRAATRRAGYKAQHALKRRRREAPFTWERMDPWPEACQSPLVGLTPCAGPLQEGHEPPVAWMLAHPDHDGPLVLRPECKQHNQVEKRDKPDWEIV